MIFLVKSANHQVASLAITTVAFIFSGISLGLVECRIWYTDQPFLPPSSLACVGMWRVCVYRHDSNSSKVKACHQYSYQDSFLPSSIRGAQHLLFSACVLGLLGKAFIILALRNESLGTRRKNVTPHLFFVSGILNLSASACISAAVLWNYHCVLNLEAIAFLPSFHVPSKPDSQEVGNAILLSTAAAFLFFLNGMFSLFHTFPPDSQVHPEF